MDAQLGGDFGGRKPRILRRVELALGGKSTAATTCGVVVVSCRMTLSFGLSGLAGRPWPGASRLRFAVLCGDRLGLLGGLAAGALGVEELDALLRSPRASGGGRSRRPARRGAGGPRRRSAVPCRGSWRRPRPGGRSRRRRRSPRHGPRHLSRPRGTARRSCATFVSPRSRRATSWVIRPIRVYCVHSWSLLCGIRGWLT